MSEYQYYEFQAIDRPLIHAEMAELRKLSTRAEITPHRFVNVYHFGDFRGDPLALMARYFDVFVYVANWGTHRFMLRLPRRLLDPRTAKRYVVEDTLTTYLKSDNLIVDFHLSPEDGGWDWEEGERWLSALLPVRAELAGGDLRALYLGWLMCAQQGLLEDEEEEAPVPPGLGALSASLSALAEFLRLDEDLLAAAAERSPALRAVEPVPGDLARWVRALPGDEKDAILLRLLERDEPQLRTELLRRFRREALPAEPPACAPERTVGELLAAGEVRAEARRRAEAEREARERARREREAAAARAAYLDGLRGREDHLWLKIETLVDERKPTAYDQAVTLLADLHALDPDDAAGAFASRLEALRQRHATKRSFLNRLSEVGL